MEADLVGLWSGEVRVPGHTDIWQFLPKFIYYQNAGTAVTVFLHNTILFQKDGTFIVTIEEDATTRDASQYQGRYSVKDAVLTMAFVGTTPGFGQETGVSFRYILSRWNDELQLSDSAEVGFQSLLSPLASEWQPRKGSLFYQGPSGPVQIETDGQLSESYHYLENGITHYADVYANWRLVQPGSPQEQPLNRMQGVRDGADFKTVTVALQAIPGLNAEIKQLQASSTVTGYSYSLELFEVADTKPSQYVWAVHFAQQAGWELEAAFVPPPTLYPSLDTPELRQLVSRLPRGTSLTYAPKWRGFGLVKTVITPDDPENGLKDFGEFCKSKGVRFDLNYNRF